MPEPVSIQVSGNIDGSIVVGDNNFVVNTNYGTIIQQQAAPQVKARAFVAQPPRAPRGFINRTAELASLENWIATHEIILLHGPDGMGKSALLRQAANLAAAKAMPHGVVMLENIDVDGQALGPDDIVQRLFDALFESNPPLKVNATSARSYLSNTHPLILMDEVGLTPALQRALPDLFPGGAILLAADAPFGADAQRLAIGPLPRAESLTLLASRAELTVDDANRTTLEKICELLGDVSLALVITGNVLRETQTSPEAALQTIEALALPERDPALLALSRAYGFAFGLLRPEEQQVLSVAALTPGVSMTPEWLSAALGNVDVSAFIERLKAMGLLFTNSPRLRLPPGFIIPARRASVLDEQSVLPRLITFLREHQENVQDELGNIFGAIAWAVKANRPADVIALGRAIDPTLTLSGLWDAWNLVLEDILNAARQRNDASVEAWALHQLGTRAIGAGTRQQALSLLRQALQIRQNLGDTTGAAYTQHNLNLLLAAPSANDTMQSKKPVKPQQSSGPNWWMLLGGLMVLGLLLLTGLIFIGWQIFNPLPTPTLTPTLTVEIITPPTDTPTPEISPTLPDASETPTDVPTITVTPTPTALGGRSGEIAFESGLEDPLFVKLLGADASSSELLKDASDPAWSPDGKKLAYIAPVTGPIINIAYPAQDAPKTRQVFVMDTSDGSVNQMTNNAFDKSHPTWSPDGKSLAFVQQTRSGSDIYMIDSNGNLYDLTIDSDGVDQNQYPEWSPKGNNIVYQKLGTDDWEIVMGTLKPDSISGMKLENVPFRGGKPVYGVQPSWSSDGKQIAFVYTNRQDGPWLLRVMNRDGSNQHTVLKQATSLFAPDWSPDGLLLAFALSDDGVTQIYAMALGGSNPQRLTAEATSATEPDWRP